MFYFLETLRLINSRQFDVMMINNMKYIFMQYFQFNFTDLELLIATVNKAWLKMSSMEIKYFILLNFFLLNF